MTDNDDLSPEEELAKLKERESQLNVSIEKLEEQEKQAGGGEEEGLPNPTPAAEETPAEEPPKEEGLPDPMPAEEPPVEQPPEDAGLPDPTEADETPVEQPPEDGLPDPVAAEEPPAEQPPEGSPDPADLFRVDASPAQEEPAPPEPPQKTPEEEEKDKQLLVMAAEKGQEAFEKMEEKRGIGCDVAAAEEMLAKSREYMGATDYMNALNTIGEAIQMIEDLTPAPEEPALPEPSVAEPPVTDFGIQQGEEQQPPPADDGLPDPAMGAQPQPAEVQQPLLTAACWNCQGEIPVYTEDRPVILTCAVCGEQVQLD